MVIAVESQKFETSDPTIAPSELSLTYLLISSKKSTKWNNDCDSYHTTRVKDCCARRWNTRTSNVKEVRRHVLEKSVHCCGSEEPGQKETCLLAP
jgi:hypothetical protein